MIIKRGGNNNKYRKTRKNLIEIENFKAAQIVC